MSKQCMFCDEPASRFCDFAIALVDSGEVVKTKGRAPYRVTSMEAMLSVSYTCDAPMCGECGEVAGFISGKESDTIDHCKGCADREDGIKGLMTPAQIAATRRQWHAQYRRSRIGSVA